MTIQIYNILGVKKVTQKLENVEFKLKLSEQLYISKMHRCALPSILLI